MSGNMNNILKGFLALVLALAVVFGLSGRMNDAQLKADEEAPEAGVVVEQAISIEALPTAKPVTVMQQISFSADGSAEEMEPVIVRSSEADVNAGSEAAEDGNAADAEVTVSIIEDPDVPLASFEEPPDFRIVPIVSTFVAVMAVLWCGMRSRKYQEQIRKLKFELLSEAIGK